MRAGPGAPDLYLGEGWGEVGCAEGVVAGEGAGRVGGGLVAVEAVVFRGCGFRRGLEDCAGFGRKRGV